MALYENGLCCERGEYDQGWNFLFHKHILLQVKHGGVATARATPPGVTD